MRLKIAHRTEYHYETPPDYGLQRIRLTPQESSTQRVHSWNIAIEGAREEVRYIDSFGNETRLLSMDSGEHTLSIEASGEVDTKDTSGVAGNQRGFAPLWLFSQTTPLTAPGPRLSALAEGIKDGEDIDRLHRLMAAVADGIAYTVGATEATTTAEEALTLGAGVCQDHTHAFTAVARLLGFPTRYVSGYLMHRGERELAASHAWAEVHVANLGWVGFDAANRVSPDDAYVALAVGRDYRDAAPVSGILLGQASERLAVRITVEQ